MLKASTIQERVLHRSLLILGGLSNLSRHLTVPENELMDWLAGFAVPPNRVFAELCALVEGSEGCRPTDTDRTAGA